MLHVTRIYILPIYTYRQSLTTAMDEKIKQRDFYKHTKWFYIDCTTKDEEDEDLALGKHHGTHPISVDVYTKH